MLTARSAAEMFGIWYDAVKVATLWQFKMVKVWACGVEFKTVKVGDPPETLPPPYGSYSGGREL